MSSPSNAETSSKFSVRKVRKNSIRKFEELNEEYSSSPTTRFLEQREAKNESDMLRALQSLPSAETAMQLTPIQPASPRPSNAGEPFEELPSSVIALQPEQVKELYPSDDDEDFDIYITIKPRSNSSGTPRESNAGLNEQQEGKKNSLKFTEYLSNPLYDKSVAQDKADAIMTEEEIIVYNEVVRLMIINGDPQCSNPYLLKRITKTVRNRTKQGMARGYVPSSTRLRSSSVLSLTSETSTDGDLDDDEEEEENKRFNIKTCSKSWKSQLKTLKQTNAPSSAPSSPPSSVTESPTFIADTLPLKSNVLYSACSPATGYIPEWKYSLTAKRILDTCRTQGFKI